MHAISEEMVTLQLTLPKEVISKLDELKALLAHGLDDVNGYSDLIAKITDRILREERKKREIKNSEMRASPEKLLMLKSSSKTLSQNPQNNRFANTFVKSQVWTRAESRCEFIDTATGRKCESRFALEIDYIKPWADGGETNLKNLQLLCGAHHRQKTELRMLV